MEKSTISAFQQVLKTWRFNHEPSTFSEDFAIKRFLKKFEVPVAGRESALQQKCWDDWYAHDTLLATSSINLGPDNIWVRVRDMIKQHFKSLCPSYFSRAYDIRFPQGSSFHSGQGRNSLSYYLDFAPWTCTYDNFDDFVRTCYHHNALKKAVRRRYNQTFRSRAELARENKRLWALFQDDPRPEYKIFEAKVEKIVVFTHGSRFTSVPKNNDKRRPINIESFGNILTQSQVGIALRRLLFRNFGIDLDQTAMRHRRLICEVDRYATIDLSNASDSVSRRLLRVLFPSWFTDLLERRASNFILGPRARHPEDVERDIREGRRVEQDYYPIDGKISAMGNGFTFELMTYILTCLCKCYSSDSSVYGDDIIITSEYAPLVIRALQNVGFVVNEDKTFIDGDFRESCGANFHRTEGYIKSFDFRWPETIGDCVVFFNKVVILSKDYAAFEQLRLALTPHVPKGARSGSDCVEQFETVEHINSVKSLVSYSIPDFFLVAQKRQKLKGIDSLEEHVGRKRLAKILQKLQDLQCAHFRWVVYGWEFRPTLRTPTKRRLHSREVGRYLMYLKAGRVCDDVITNVGKWVCVFYVTDGYRTMRIGNLI